MLAKAIAKRCPPGGLDPTTGRGTTGRGTTGWPGRAGSGRWIPPSPAPLPGGPPHAPCRSSSGPDGDHAGCGGRSAAALPPAEMTVPRPGPPPRQDPSRSHRMPRPGGNPRSHRARPSSSPRPAPPAACRACGRCCGSAVPGAAAAGRAGHRCSGASRREPAVTALLAPQLRDLGPQFLHRPPQLRDHLVAGGARGAPGSGRWQLGHKPP